MSLGAPFSDQGPAMVALGTAVQAHREETMLSSGLGTTPDRGVIEQRQRRP